MILHSLLVPSSINSIIKEVTGIDEVPNDLSIDTHDGEVAPRLRCVRCDWWANMHLLSTLNRGAHWLLIWYLAQRIIILFIDALCYKNRFGCSRVIKFFNIHNNYHSHFVSRSVQHDMSVLFQFFFWLGISRLQSYSWENTLRDNDIGVRYLLTAFLLVTVGHRADHLTHVPMWLPLRFRRVASDVSNW